MDSSKFAEAFPPLGEKVQPSNQDRREILEAPRQWMRFFNETLGDYLSDELPPDVDWLRQKLVEYFVWNQQHLDVLEKDARTIPIASGATSPISSEFSFHKLSAPMILFWDTLAERWAGNTGDISYALPAIQTHLAATSIQNIQRHRHLVAKPVLTQAEINERNQLVGTVSEIDAALTLIEVAKDHPELLILPAPSQYEANPMAGRRNSDFVVINTNQKQAHGVQVKSSAPNRSTVLRYDSHYTTVIDGILDLGNMSTDRLTHKISSAPGQLATHLLAGLPINTQHPFIDRPDFMQKRAIARELSRNSKPYLDTAKQHIAERILRGLYIDEQTEETESTEPAA